MYRTPRVSTATCVAASTVCLYKQTFETVILGRCYVPIYTRPGATPAWDGYLMRSVWSTKQIEAKEL